MSHEIKILSAYNGNTHESIIRRSEVLIGIEVDGNVVYFDEAEGKNFGVTIDEKERDALEMLESSTRIWRLKRPKRSVQRECKTHGSIEHMQSATGLCPGCGKR